jgi:1-acyl-sn-glycerol-3-phosphate acyltransferase
MTLAEFSSDQNDPRDRKAYYFHVTTFRMVMTFLARHLFKLIMKLEVRGAEHLPEEGAVVIAANHSTTFDVFPMQFSLPRPIFFMGKAELFRSPIIDWAFRQMGGFPIHRGAQDQWAYHHALKVLQRQQVLGMFPEGTRSRGHGLTVAKTGAAKLALETHSPLVPVSITGSHTFFKNFPHRNHVIVTLCPPIVPQEDDTPISLTDKLMFALAQNLPPDLRGVYAEHPPGFDA